MGIEIKANITATCDKCGKQERIREADRNAVKLPDGWMNVSDQGIFCKECYKKYEEEQKKKDDESYDLDDDKSFIKNLDKKIMNRENHTLDLDDVLECIERFGIYKFFYPDINSFDSDMISEMEFVSSFAMEALDRALNNGEIMICKNALKHKE